MVGTGNARWSASGTASGTICRQGMGGERDAESSGETLSDIEPTSLEDGSGVREQLDVVAGEYPFTKRTEGGSAHAGADDGPTVEPGSLD